MTACETVHCGAQVTVAHTSMSVDALAEPALAGFFAELLLVAALGLPFFLGLASWSLSSSESSKRSSPSWPASKAARFSSPSRSSTGTSAQHGALGLEEACVQARGAPLLAEAERPHVKSASLA